MRKSFAVLPFVALLAVGCSEAPNPVGPDVTAPSFSVLKNTDINWAVAFYDKEGKEQLGVDATNYTPRNGEPKTEGTGAFKVDKVARTLRVDGLAAEHPCGAYPLSFTLTVTVTGDPVPRSLTITQETATGLAAATLEDYSPLGTPFVGKLDRQCPS